MIFFLYKIIQKHLFSFTFIFIFISINYLYYSFLHFSFDIFSIIYALLLELSAFGLAFEISELSLILFLPRSIPKKISALQNKPPVALLYVTCDDINLNALKHLGNQSYKNMKVFILDDSKLKKSCAIVDSSGFYVIRRSNRLGYKAGNLNNWLRKHSKDFKYFVVADADSILPPYFIEQMLSYAEHDENSNISIFESLIFPWNKVNNFVESQSLMLPLSNRRKLHIDNFFGTTLSVGHNNLYRTEDIIDIGGFQENYIAEDYATCIELLKRNKNGCKTLPIISYERLPSNLNEFAKRQARWAYQTFQLLSLSTSGISLNVYLVMLRTFHHYSTPIIFLIGMLMITAHNLLYGISAQYLFNNPNIINIFFNDKIFFFWIFFLLFPVTLRLFLCTFECIPIPNYFKSAFFHTALFTATIWPIIYRLSSFISGDKNGYNVTGISPYPSLTEIIMIGLPGFVISWIALLSIASNPFFSSLNLIWVLPSSISPFLLYHYQKKLNEQQK